MMEKSLAVFRLGGSEDQAAKWIGISTVIFKQWPERLHPSQADRVLAAILRREAAQALGMTHRQFFTHCAGEAVMEKMLAQVSIAAVMASLLPRVPPEFELREEPRKPKRKRPGRTARAARPIEEQPAAVPG